MLELDYEGVKRQRCVTCAKRLFGEEPPVTFPEEDNIAVPQPSLPMEVERRPDFVTPGQLRRSSRFNSLPADVRMRQTGEEG